MAEAQPMDAPAISVVMAVYNGEAFLPAAIDSVIAQTMADFELIVVDDCSSDATSQILDAYAAKDARIRLLPNEGNLGPYPSANRAIAAAGAPLIARLDADDLCHPERLAQQLDYMNANPDCLLCGGGYRSIDGDGATRFIRHNAMDPQTAAFVARLRMPMVHPTFCFRSTLPNGTPVRYDEAFPIAGDYELAARLSRHGGIAALDALLVDYRMHAANISSTKLDRQQHYAHEVASKAVTAHYPAEIATDLTALIDVTYARAKPSAQLLQQAVRGLDAALRMDGESKPMKERAAGILAEAFLKPESRMSLALPFALHARRFLLPLMRRYRQLQAR